MMAAHTGRQEHRICPRCKQSVLYKESAFFGGPASVWLAEPHSAPCGLRCWGAGVKGREGLAAMRAKQLHGHEKYPCPSCGERWVK
jgi:hypothetical protein